MKWYSQAGQDRFVHHVTHDLLGLQFGTFWDIGCGDWQYSNTLALEDLGWSGLLVDSSPHAGEFAKLRRSLFVLGDATKIDWVSYLSASGFVDYLSLDVDDLTFKVLNGIPLDKVQFRMATIEHDAYDHGDELRGPTRELMHTWGYRLLCSDVTSMSKPFEDWYVHPSLTPVELAQFQCSSKEGLTIAP